MRSLFVVILASALLPACTRKAGLPKSEYDVLANTLCATFASDTLHKHERDLPVFKQVKKFEVRDFVFSAEADKKLRALLTADRKRIDGAKSFEQREMEERAHLLGLIDLLKKETPDYMRLCGKLSDALAKCGGHEKEKLKACIQKEQEAPMSALVGYLNRWHSLKAE